jgi:RNA dependent RNA polymerase
MSFSLGSSSFSSDEDDSWASSRQEERTNNNNYTTNNHHQTSSFFDSSSTTTSSEGTDEEDSFWADATHTYSNGILQRTVQKTAAVPVSPPEALTTLTVNPTRIPVEDRPRRRDTDSPIVGVVVGPLIQSTNIYAAKTILDYHSTNDAYLVLWEGYDEPTWVPHDDIFKVDSPLKTDADVVRGRVLQALGRPDQRGAGGRRTEPRKKVHKRQGSSSAKYGIGRSSRQSRRKKKKSSTTTTNDWWDGSSIQSSLRMQTVHRLSVEMRERLQPVSPLWGDLISAFHGDINQLRVDGTTIKNRVVAKPTKTTFLRYLLTERLALVDKTLTGGGGAATEQRYPQRIHVDGQECELLCVKIDKDKEAGSPFQGGGHPQKAAAVYVSVSPCKDSSLFHIKDFLLGFGDFSVLDPRKIAARLELFQSPAKFIEPLPLDVFGEIEEQGNVGCGFIESDFLEQLCQRGGVKHAEMVSAIQVRLFIPSMGIFKGMLQKKQIRLDSGGPMIQLPPSMKKVPASSRADRSSELGYIVVCQAGVHTSRGGANDYIGRNFNGTLKAHKTFESVIKPLKEMVLELWSSLGVSEKVLVRYERQSRKAGGHNHAWVVGTADPTGRLPPDRVFIPGMGNKQPKRIFVTRAPCLRHDDGRLLRTVTNQPRGMSRRDWEFLHSLPFGSIIFSRPRAGKMSMPERIAQSDLDGDLYLICWDDEVLSEMIDTEKMPDLDREDDGILRILPSSNPHWLEDAQKLMSDAPTINEIGRLRGSLYRMSMKIGETSQQKKRDPDAMALADAYRQTLEFTKHGRPIRLPEHLIAGSRRLEQFEKILTPLETV